MRNLFRSSPARLSAIAFSLFFALSVLSRVLLLLAARHDLSWDLSLGAVVACGFYFDVAAGLFAALPWMLVGVVAPVRALKSKAGLLLVAALMTVYASIFIFITTSEWLFWDEFSARFNFIAVDYLVWTQEVWGNISESYPMVPIIGGIVLAGVLVSWLMMWKGVFAWVFAGTTTWIDRCGTLAAGLGLATLAAMFVSQPSLPAFANQYNAELAKNGCWSFFAAVKQMELEYTQWYPMLPPADARAEAKRLLVTSNETATSPSPEDLHRTIKGNGPEKRWNVILVCMESMSADYMTYGGSKIMMTPCLDKLANESLFFDNLLATGTRTVRGMEAITLNLPPTPGQAIIYRPEGTDLVITFTPFLKRGYDCGFFYGGDGRFDYMNRYFGTAGCRIMDAGAWEKSDTTFKTSWGSCDEDLFNKTISEADKAAAAGRPFHFFCMTTSNHRPFAYPATVSNIGVNNLL